MSAPSILFPPRLIAGDTIGLAAPASPPEQAELIDQVIARFTSLGFKIKPGKNLREKTGYLAGSDAARAEDINTLFADPEVQAVFALRGGYGSCRLLPLLDYDMIRVHPKPFLGYSDITAMHNAILRETGLITFHGSNASSAFGPENATICRRMLVSEDGSRRPPEIDDTRLFSREQENGAKLKTIVPGTAQGPLIGGNMTCLLRLLGTPYEPDFRGVILFLEDTGEKAYRVDGLFTHLHLAKLAPQISGLVIGQFDHPDPEEERRIEACLEREARRLGVPCVTGAPIGHFTGQIMVPHGAMGELDADTATLRFAL